MSSNPESSLKIHFSGSEPWLKILASRCSSDFDSESRRSRYRRTVR